jgi:hypothetical protein
MPRTIEKRKKTREGMRLPYDRTETHENALLASHRTGTHECGKHIRRCAGKEACE